MRNYLKPLQHVKTKKAYTIFTSVLVMIFSVLVFLDAAKSEVVIAADGDVQTVKTNTETVGELLKDLGIDVEENDELSHGENTEIVDGMEIRFESANEILLTIDGETEEYKTTAITVGQFFQDEELEFSRYDDISHSDIAILDDDIEIEVTSAVPVELNDGGEKEKVWTTEDTVEDFLENEEIEYDEDEDRIKPELDEEIEEDMKVNVTYVETEEVEEEESLSYHTKKKDDNSLAKGEEKTEKEGKKGKVSKTYEITKENGEEVSRELIDEEVLKESKDEVIAVGTKEESSSSNDDQKSAEKESKSKESKGSKESKESSGSKSSSSSSNSDSGSGKSMTMDATAYGPDCAGCSGVSATGMDLSDGPKVIAVDPSVIPLGSKVWVEGYGEAIAGDTGGDIQGNRIDVLYPTESEASKWGRKSVEVKVLD
ncbi:MAG TPA: ubiquitin-like domain-containing protein [Pseudogracilibacillus sp.]|nr:ubiquitin-like domain-containing protein [Pseudogracilibacillus sp.]